MYSLNHDLSVAVCFAHSCRQTKIQRVSSAHLDSRTASPLCLSVVFLPPPHHMDQRIELVISSMEKNLSKRSSVETLAALVNLSPSRLRHLFKEQIGVTPSRYMKTLRLKRAEELLDTTFLTIKEIANQIGMSVSNFVREFRVVHGRTPTLYRESFLHKNARSPSD